MGPVATEPHIEPRHAATLTVSELLHAGKEQLKARWPAPVWVGGELSNVRRYPSGHVYMTLKDDKAEVSCIMYASTARRHASLPDDGTAVLLLATPTIYEAKGRFQLIVNKVRIEGLGQLHERFLQTKDRLLREGWFDDGRKRPIPTCPSMIGVVVSLHGSAWHDIQKTLAERWPAASVMVFPAPAQGQDAAPLIAAAIRRAGLHPCDALIVARGGGSLEDLWPYNEVAVAEAILKSPVPVITGVGHETDTTISDFVADCRASTPTAAAAAATQTNRRDATRRLSQQSGLLYRAVRQSVGMAQQRLDDATDGMLDIKNQIALARVRTDSSLRRLGQGLRLRTDEGKREALDLLSRLRQVGERIRWQSRSLNNAAGRLAGAAHSLTTTLARKMDEAAARLGALSPQRTLERGYALAATREGKIISSAGSLSSGEDAILQFADGSVEARVTKETGETDMDVLPNA